jgi:hypothetical protein
VNGRTRPSADMAFCPLCGAHIALIPADGTLEAHVQQGSYDRLCKALWPAGAGRRQRRRRSASIQFGAGLGLVISTLVIACTAPPAPPDRLTTVTGTTTTEQVAP